MTDLKKHMIVSSRVRLARNIAKIPFPFKMSPFEAASVIDKVFNALKSTGEYNLYKLNELSDIECLSLKERYLISNDLIKNAKTKPWFNDTLFVFIADHGAGSAGKQELNPETHRIPWIFYAPKHVKPKRYDFPVSQIDMLPTLLGLLNFDYDSVFYGKDALKPDYAPRYFVSNYQYVGYSKDKDLVVLKPVKAVTYYKDGKQTKEPLPDLLEGAVSYYQHASDWRDLYRNVSADNKSPK